jgi:hypothetical protein
MLTLLWLALVPDLWRRSSWRRSSSLEHINADGFEATANLRRHRGENSTSMRETLLRSGHRCSRPIHHEVMRSPWRFGGPWLRFVAGRGLLGGDTSRTLASGGRGTRGLLCKLFSGSRVVFVKSSALSLDRTFPRAKFEMAVYAYCTCHVSINGNSGVF